MPRSGQHLIQVGRVREIETLVADIARIADGGSAFRVVIGEYGAGKTFFLNLVRAVALEKKLVVATADLNPDRRLHASGGQARSLYAELMRNLSTRTKPDGVRLRASSRNSSPLPRRRPRRPANRPRRSCASSSNN